MIEEIVATAAVVNTWDRKSASSSRWSDAAWVQEEEDSYISLGFLL